MGSLISKDQTEDFEARNVTLSADLTRQRHDIHDMKQEICKLRDITRELENRCANIRTENGKLRTQIIDLIEKGKRDRYTIDAQNNEIKQLRNLTKQKDTIWNRLDDPQIRTEIISEMLKDDSINSHLMDDAFERKYIDNVLTFLYRSIKLALQDTSNMST
jgi:predicted  nucleic acid-binding Zn-ribbon protein